MNISHLIAKPETVLWQPGMILAPGMVVKCFGNELFAVIKAARENGMEILTLSNNGRNSEWHAKITTKHHQPPSPKPDRHGYKHSTRFQPVRLETNG